PWSLLPTQLQTAARLNRTRRGGQGLLDEREKSAAMVAFQLPPFVADLDIRLLHRGPCGAVGDLLLPGVTGMRGERRIERRPVNILGMRRQVMANRGRQVGIGAI